MIRNQHFEKEKLKDWLLGLVKKNLETVGDFVLFGYQALCGVNQKKIWDLWLANMNAIGLGSIGIVGLSAVMIGAVFGIQFGTIFKMFGAESMIGAAASFALSKELAPLITAFLIIGRSGSSMTAEIASMKVNEQIDALKVLGVNPISYLVTPRMYASMMVLPLLSGVFVIIGIISSYIVAVEIFQVDRGVFVENIKSISKPAHLIEGLQKALFFGGMFSSVCCYTGFHAMGGAKGVGTATTQAVVISLVLVLIFDFFISYLQIRFS